MCMCMPQFSVPHEYRCLTAPGQKRVLDLQEQELLGCCEELNLGPLDEP